jgi:hypothetical protein
LCPDLLYGYRLYMRNDAMRRILALVLLSCLLQQSEAAPRKDQVIAKGSGPVPGAIICPDFRALQAGFRSFTSRWGPRPEYFGCTIVKPGTIMTLEGEDPGGAPMVSAILPDGRPVRGVTLNGMVERFAFKPKKAAVSPPKPAPAQPDAASETEAKGGNMPLPAIQNSPDTFCEAQRQCNAEEFSAKLATLQKRWALMPDWLQQKCTTSLTLPAMDQCVSSETTSWSNANPDKETPWMAPELLN